MKVGAESGGLGGLPRAGGVWATSSGRQQPEGMAGVGRGALASRKHSLPSVLLPPPGTTEKQRMVKHHITVFLGWQKGGKFSPRSSLTSAARHRGHPAGDGSPTAPQAVPSCRPLPNLGSGLWARAPRQHRDVHAVRGAELGSPWGPPCVAARWGELRETKNPWEKSFT